MDNTNEKNNQVYHKPRVGNIIFLTNAVSILRQSFTAKKLIKMQVLQKIEPERNLPFSIILRDSDNPANSSGYSFETIDEATDYVRKINHYILTGEFLSDDYQKSLVEYTEVSTEESAQLAQKILDRKAAREKKSEERKQEAKEAYLRKKRESHKNSSNKEALKSCELNHDSATVGPDLTNKRVGDLLIKISNCTSQSTGNSIANLFLFFNSSLPESAKEIFRKYENDMNVINHGISAKLKHLAYALDHRSF